MKQTISKHGFIDAFADAGRYSQFSYQAKGLLFDHLEEYEESTGEEIELDVIAICCEYEEADFKEVISNYSLDPELSEDEVIDWLSDHTSYIGQTPTGLVYASF